MLACFDIPAAWKPEAPRHALHMLLQSCRDSAWSTDPSLSFGLVNRDRAELLRLAERLTAPKPEARSTPEQILFPGEKAQLRASLAATGYSDKEFVNESTTDTVQKIEAELRTLHVRAYTLLTS
jgi:hypothetical protein